MSSLAGRFVVLGVSGGIAAYKSIEVCRRLVDAGAHVAPILTESAQRFVGAATFSALASEVAHTSLWADPDRIPHTRLGQSADLILVCPATARAIAAYRMGLSDDLLTATLLATRAPVVVAPAMHTEMWEQASVQENLTVLAERGVTIVPPESGRLAGGDVGAGRLADPATVVDAAHDVLAGRPYQSHDGGHGSEPSGSVAPGTDLAGLRVLVTAGGTREPIDPVRFITNRSSGRQGHAFADVAAARGASVTLITTSGLETPPAAKVVRVETAADMHEAVTARWPETDVVVMAAAVADFAPAEQADNKIKKADGWDSIELVPTADILAGLGSSKSAGQILIGFAAETTDVAANAQKKLVSKNADLLVANDLTEAGAGFAGDTNRVLLLSATGEPEQLPLQSKHDVAAAVLDRVVELRRSQT